MLVISREVDQAILLGDGKVGRIVVVDIRSGTVRLGLEFPKDVVIDREELAEENRTKREAGTARNPLWTPKEGQPCPTDS